VARVIETSHEPPTLADELLLLSRLQLEPNAWSLRSLPKQRECATVAGPGRVRLVLPPAGPQNTGDKLRASNMLNARLLHPLVRRPRRSLASQCMDAAIAAGHSASRHSVGASLNERQLPIEGVEQAQGHLRAVGVADLA